MASLRNLVLTIPRLAGATSIAALRHHARRPDRPVRTTINCQTTLPAPCGLYEPESLDTRSATFKTFPRRSLNEPPEVRHVRYYHNVR
jgi:hypothetical protein